MVLKEFVGIHSKPPGIGVIIDAQHPRTQYVALFVLICCLAGITASVRKECVPIGAEACSVLQNVESSIAFRYVSRASELCCHLQSCLYGEREECVLVAHFQVTRFAVIQYPVGISLLTVGEVVLPVVVGVLSVCDVSFQMEPSSGKRDCPIFGQRQSHLRHRTGIDAKSLRTARQQVVLHLHRIVLASYCKCSAQPTQFAVCLLHNELAGVVERHHKVNAVAYAPASA